MVEKGIGMKQTVQLDSTAIKQVTYDDETKILSIEFQRGAEYDYPDVPKVEFTNLINAPSAGKYYNAHIKQYSVKV